MNFSFVRKTSSLIKHMERGLPEQSVRTFRTAPFVHVKETLDLAVVDKMTSRHHFEIVCRKMPLSKPPLNARFCWRSSSNCSAE